MDLFEAAEASRHQPTPEQLGPISVTALTSVIKQVVEEGFPSVWVVGQVSNISRATSGHVYLTLKDDGAEIGAVIWKGAAQRLPFRIDNGQEIIVHGRLSVYEKRGCYQIVVTAVQPKGMGALQLAFIQMKEKLAAEGLFNPLRKRPLPFLPGTIAIVTSPTGAAIQDMLKMITGRMPNAHVLLYPVAVQGEEAAGQIAAAIRDISDAGIADVMIVGRGGGSLEDLWAFNEEVVARAIYASKIPVISAVGHEVDISISDLVADVRALTPTHAGELVVPSIDELEERLELNGTRLVRALSGSVVHARSRLEGLAQSYGMRQPLDYVRRGQQRLDENLSRMKLVASREMTRTKESIASLEKNLISLSPRNVMARGYSITTLAGSSKPIRSASEVTPGSKLRTIFDEGETQSSA